LQVLNKGETAAKYGDERVLMWRRSFDTRPPALEKEDERSPVNDPRYKNLGNNEILLTESLNDAVSRFLPCLHIYNQRFAVVSRSLFQLTAMAFKRLSNTSIACQMLISSI
jgi:bisphosphoglycerate-dependent phosphoglycerate mutase family 1